MSNHPCPRDIKRVGQVVEHLAHQKKKFKFKIQITALENEKEGWIASRKKGLGD